MKKKVGVVAGVVVAAMTYGVTANAGSYWCGNKFITDGDSVAKVMGRCGTPTHKLTTRDGVVGPCVEKWYFVPDSKKRFTHILTVKDGVVSKVEFETR